MNCGVAETSAARMAHVFRGMKSREDRNRILYGIARHAKAALGARMVLSTRLIVQQHPKATARYLVCPESNHSSRRLPASTKQKRRAISLGSFIARSQPVDCGQIADRVDPSE